MWNENQSKNQQIRNYHECFERTIKELQKQHECVTHQLEETNKHLEDKCNRLEDSLNKEMNNVLRLQSKNETLEGSLERISDKLCDVTKTLNETNDELERKKDEHRELTLETKIINDKLLWTIEKYNIEKQKDTRDIEIMGVELKLRTNRNTGLNATVREQNDRLQIQAETLKESNWENDKLKRMIITEQVRADELSNELKREKSRAINEKKYLEKRLNEYLKRSQCVVLENDRLKSEIKELRYQLDITVKNHNEKQKSSVEEIDRIDKQVKRLNVEINLKSRINAKLEEQLLSVKRTCKKKKENMKNSSSEAVNVHCNTLFFQNYATVLDELKSIDEYPYEKKESFEKFISRYEEIISNNYNK